MKKLVATSLMLGALAACSESPAETEQVQTDNRPNVLVILLDDMGYGDVGAYNPASKIATPSLDALAAGGMRFTDAHSAGSTCKPSRFGLMTGQNPVHMTRPYEEGLIEPGTPTIATTLRDAGYRTSMVGKWHLGLVDEKNPAASAELTGGPMDHGFDYFFGMPASLDIQPYYYIEGRKAVELPTVDVAASPGYGPRPIQGPFYRAGKMGASYDHNKVLFELTDKAVEQIDELANEERPWLLYVALPTPHTPWLPSDKNRGKSGAGEYGDYVMDTDDQIGRMMKALEASGTADNTLVIVTSDNGPVWYSVDEETTGHEANGILAGMKGDVMEGAHRLPFIIRWPGTVAAGSISDSFVQHADILATLAEIAGTTLTGNDRQDSISFLGALKGSNDPARRSNFRNGSSRDVITTFRQGDWKLILDRGFGGFTDRTFPEVIEANAHEGRLYNLAADPGETNNLFGEMPDKVAEMKAALEAAVASEKATQ